MAEYTPKTIYELIKEIEEGRVVLPAMQRNFVWEESKICKLFESIMRDYPIGTFLFWMVEQETFNAYVFNNFIRDYDEQLGKMQRGKKATAVFTDYTAVLDGQQRITSLYMGVKGKYRTHIRGKVWDKPESYVDRFLCIDVLFVPDKDEEYRFAFLQEEKIEKLIKDENGNVVLANACAIDTNGCILYGDGDKLIATLGVGDIVVAQTKDIVLVCDKKRAQDIKLIPEKLSEMNKDFYC